MSATEGGDGDVHCHYGDDDDDDDGGGDDGDEDESLAWRSRSRL
jgi:hypothetical protein